MNLVANTPILLAAVAFAFAPTMAAPQSEDSATSERRVVVEVRTGGGSEPTYVVGETGPYFLEPHSARRAYLGVQLLDLTPELRRHFGGREEAGVLISSIEPDSPAQRAGCAVGDMLVSVEAEPASSTRQVARAIARRKAGDTLRIGLLRDAAPLELEAVLEESERPQVDLGGILCLGGQPCRLEDEEGLHAFRHVFPIDSAELNTAMERLNEELGSPQWREKVLRFKGGYEDLEVRIHELEERLRTLQEQLDNLPQ